jgi:hypothetical protein
MLKLIQCHGIIKETILKDDWVKLERRPYIFRKLFPFPEYRKRISYKQ